MMAAAQQRGFTLVEALLASVILAVTVVAIAQAIAAGHVQSYEAVHARRAVAAAEEMLERILALPYHDPDGASAAGPEADEATVADFDNADDFDGYTENPGGLTDAWSNAYPDGFANFSRAVSAAYETLDVPPLGGARSGLTVTVTVTDEAGRSWRLRRFIAEPPAGS